MNINGVPRVDSPNLLQLISVQQADYAQKMMHLNVEPKVEADQPPVMPSTHNGRLDVKV